MCGTVIGANAGAGAYILGPTVIQGSTSANANDASASEGRSIDPDLTVDIAELGDRKENSCKEVANKMPNPDRGVPDVVPPSYGKVICVASSSWGQGGCATATAHEAIAKNILEEITAPTRAYGSCSQTLGSGTMATSGSSEESGSDANATQRPISELPPDAQERLRMELFKDAVEHAEQEMGCWIPQNALHEEICSGVREDIWQELETRDLIVTTEAI